ncbi:MAG: discoidin domain-containing protein [Myxococcales bacterium]|nr:discoidin domain-containing protein [Myxococcales bacterium]
MDRPILALAAVVVLGCRNEAPPAPKPAASASASTVASAPAPSASVAASASAPGPVKPTTRFLARLFPDESSASTEFHDAKIGEHHPAKHAFDGTRATSWNQDGKPAVKVEKGEWLEAKFKKKQSLHVLRIDTGFNDWSAKFGDLFLRNSHVKKLTVTIDGGAPIVREVKPDERVVTVRLERPLEAKTVRVTFDDLYAGDRWPELGITEIGFFGDPPKVVDEAATSKTIAGIDANYEADSAGRAAGLAMDLGMPIPAELVENQRARITDTWADLDGLGRDYRVVSLTFRTRPSGGTRRQILMTAILGRVAPGKLALLASDLIVARPDEFGFDNQTKLEIAPHLHAEDRDDLALRWAHASLDPSGQRVKQTGLRVWSCMHGFPEPVFEQIFDRAEKTKNQSDFEPVELQADHGKVGIRIAGAAKGSFAWHAPSGIFVPE